MNNRIKSFSLFESLTTDKLESLLNNEIFLELIDDDLADIHAADGDVSVTITFDENEAHQVTDIVEFHKRVLRKAYILGRLKIALKKLEEYNYKYNIDEICDDYIHIDIILPKFENEYILVADEYLDGRIPFYLKKGDIERDFKCTIGSSSNGSGYWIDVIFLGTADNDEAAKEFLDTFKKFKYEGKLIMGAVSYGGGGGGTSKLPNNSNSPFGEHFSKDNRHFAEVRKDKSSTGYNRINNVSIIKYSFGVNPKFIVI